MSFLRRRLGGDRAGDADRQPPMAQVSDEDVDAAEREHEHEIMRAEAERLDDLRQRQLRYAGHAWRPPGQGGERRSDDEGSGQG